MSAVIMIRWLCPSETEAKQLVEALLDKRWIACANIHPNIVSYYRWKGQKENSAEVLVELKTIQSHEQRILQFLADHASYDIPAMMSFSSTGGGEDYLAWIRNEIND